jgi:hypothetical protein
MPAKVRWQQLRRFHRETRALRAVQTPDYCSGKNVWRNAESAASMIARNWRVTAHQRRKRRGHWQTELGESARKRGSIRSSSDSRSQAELDPRPPLRGAWELVEHMVERPPRKVSHHGCKQCTRPVSLHDSKFPTVRGKEPGHFEPPRSTWQCPCRRGEAAFKIAPWGRCEHACIRVERAGEPRYEGHDAARVTGTGHYQHPGFHQERPATGRPCLRKLEVTGCALESANVHR